MERRERGRVQAVDNGIASEREFGVARTVARYVEAIDGARS
jgi:hypothetical protein